MNALTIVDGLIRNLDTALTMSIVQDEEKKQSSVKQEKLLMIPGPTEFDPIVYEALSRKTVSHVAPSFIAEFGECLDNLGKLLCASNEDQPFVLSGGGTLGWDCIVSALCETELKHEALILNGGYFSDNFRECCKAYNIKINEINASCIGDAVTSKQLEEYFTNKENENVIKKLKLICVTQVDTSTAVCINVKEISSVIKKYAPNAFIAVDGVCAFLGEELRFNEWGIDAAMTASQKAFGCPPGLCMLVISKRAIDYIENGRKNPIRSFYSSLGRWLPIMRAYQSRKGSYFSTPNVNLICALNASCKKLVKEGIDQIVKRHKGFSDAFKLSMKSIGLQFVPVRDDIYASTITAIKFPKGVDGPTLLKTIKMDKGIIFAGGLHKEVKKTYFRVGHMGYSTRLGCNDLLKCVEAIEYGLEKCGYDFKKGVAINAFNEAAKASKLM